MNYIMFYHFSFQSICFHNNVNKICIMKLCYVHSDDRHEVATRHFRHCA